jgi:hypothetical protein
MSQPATLAPHVATSRLFRRLVLGTAFFLGLAVALAPRSPTVHAQEPASAPATAPTAPKPPTKSLSITDGRGAEIKVEVGDKGRATVTAEAPAGAKAEAATPPEAADSNAGGRRAGSQKKRARVTIDGMDDHEFDSFGEMANNEPALFAMIVAVVAVVFFAPVLAIALIIGYRMRKARMLNETMLKLAEKGIVPSAEAIDALAGGKQPAAAAPYYEQAKQVRRRAAWSDLRKGVLMVGFGFALSMYSLLGSRTPNAIGLVLLFVGAGFVVLWWFEQRHLAPAEGTLRGAAPDAGSGASPGNPPLA